MKTKGGEYDLILRGGLLADGSGSEPFTADIAVRSGRIAAVGPVKGHAREEIDARGKLVTPGFVDIHTHYDGQAIWSEQLTPSSSHGVTTAVLGNCGVGFAPCKQEDHELLVSLMEGVEDIPGAVMAEGLDWTWESFPEYLDALATHRHDIDVAAYFPHSPLRVYVMGARGANREPATSQDLLQMRALAREAIDAGAIGVSSSRLFMHRTKHGQQIPSYDASQEELRAIAAGMSDAGSGTFQIVLDYPRRSWDAEMASLIDIVSRSGRPATFTLGLANQGPREWENAFSLLDAANAQGASITAQILPRPIGLLAGHQLSVNPFLLCPSYEVLGQLPFERRITELRKPEWRARLLAEKPIEGHPLTLMARMWDWMFPFGEPPNYEPAVDTSIGAQARARQKTPEELAYDLLLEQDGRAMLLIAFGNYYEGSLDTLHELIRRQHTVIGLGDGGAHYGAICDASYPTHLLTYWTRDRAGARLTIAEAVRALTHDTARAVGLLDRGLIRQGYKADLNVIDWEHLTLHAPRVKYDLPAGGRRLDQTATGYEATIVSGQVVRRYDEPTGMIPGRLVRGSQHAPSA